MENNFIGGAEATVTFLRPDIKFYIVIMISGDFIFL